MIQVSNWLVQYTTLHRESNVPSGRREEGGGHVANSEARFVRLCEAVVDGSAVELIVLILRSDMGVVVLTWMILLLLAELVKPSSVLELWVVEVMNSDELEHAE